jgi:hypothetical protein
MALRTPAKLILSSLVACIVSGVVFVPAMAGIAGCVTGSGCSDGHSLMRIGEIGGWSVLVSVAGMLIGVIWHVVSTRREKRRSERQTPPEPRHANTSDGPRLAPLLQAALLHSTSLQSGLARTK